MRIADKNEPRIAPIIPGFLPPRAARGVIHCAVLLLTAVCPAWALSAPDCAKIRSSAGPGLKRTAASARFKSSCLAGASMAPRLLGAAGRQLRLSEVRLRVFSGSHVLADYDSASPQFTANLNVDNSGLYNWVYVNSSGAVQTDVKAVAFLDADIDVGVNGYANESGAMVSLVLPPGAPSGAAAPSTWEIDEPGYVFGNIFQHFTTGILDNSNAVPASAPDDVSMALGFNAGSIAPGGRLTVTMSVSKTNIGGLKQSDPASGVDIYYNGSAQGGLVAPGVPIAGPISLAVAAAAFVAVAWFALRRGGEACA